MHVVGRDQQSAGQRLRVCAGTYIWLIGRGRWTELICVQLNSSCMLCKVLYKGMPILGERSAICNTRHADTLAPLLHYRQIVSGSRCSVNVYEWGSEVQEIRV